MKNVDALTLVKAVRKHVDELLVATAVAQVERERVDAIQRKVLAENQYSDGSVRITEPRDSWHMDDESSKAYYAELNAIHLAAGFERAADGYCPALCAEQRQIECEWALIGAAHKYTGITNNQLLCGTDEKCGLEFRKEYLDLLIGLVVNSPGYAKTVKTGAAR